MLANTVPETPLPLLSLIGSLKTANPDGTKKRPIVVIPHRFSQNPRPSKSRPPFGGRQVKLLSLIGSLKTEMTLVNSFSDGGCYPS
jgi:hypothetical protein